MKTYKPGIVTNQELLRELYSIVQAAQRADPWMALQYLTAPPDRPFAGQIVLADGSNWDPGSGEGLYRRNADNSAWTFIG